MSEEHIAYILREVVKVSNLTRVSYLKNYLSVVVKKKYLSTFKYIIVVKNLKKKSVAYSSPGSHTGQLDFCNYQ